jgi:serine/threonine-protein kinase
MTVPCPICHHPNRDAAQFCAACAAPIVLAGRFKVLHKIGQGGMSIVYQVEDLRLSGKVWAAKEMSDVGLSDPIEKQRAIAGFKQEAQILARLQHPNIPQVIDSFQQGNRHYIVTEYVDGMTLHDMLTTRGRPFPEIEVRAWLTQLCDVLSYLHGCQPPIVFRDLKPQNIMIDRTGQVKLIDFGIARFFKPGKAKDTMLLGTPGYAPPEQHGQGQTDVRSDIFALGVTLYQLLTGHDPTRTPYNLPPVRALAPSISPAMEQIVQRAIEMRPQDRWQSIAEIQAALRGKWSVQHQSHRVGMSVGQPQQGPYVGTPINVKRPTTRLIVAVATLSNRQLVTLLIVSAVTVALGVWLLAPVVEQEVPFIWNSLPAFVIAGPLAFAALQQRWTAISAHILITLVGWVTLWARSGYTPPSYVPLLAATLFSGGVIELMMAYLPRIKGHTNADAWKRELGWYAVAALATAIIFYLVQGNVFLALRLSMWVGAALLGATGWFLGDLVQQWLYLRKTGIKRIKLP